MSNSSNLTYPCIPGNTLCGKCLRLHVLYPSFIQLYLTFWRICPYQIYLSSLNSQKCQTWHCLYVGILFPMSDKTWPMVKTSACGRLQRGCVASSHEKFLFTDLWCHEDDILTFGWTMTITFTFFLCLQTFLLKHTFSGPIYSVLETRSHDPKECIIIHYQKKLP